MKMYNGQRSCIKKIKSELKSVRLHYTNVHGLGAKQVVNSLVPALRKKVSIGVHYISNNGDLIGELNTHKRERFSVYKRHLPKAVSRLLECMNRDGRFEGDGPLIVLGDLPLRCRGPQFVLVHSPHLVASMTHSNLKELITYWVSRRILKWNSKYVTAFFVQSELVAAGLMETIGIAKEQIVVIPPPPPDWVISGRIKRSHRVVGPRKGLKLFYPAAEYPHKNHKIIWEAQQYPEWENLVESLVVTIPKPDNLSIDTSIDCRGILKPADVLDMYSNSDALIFPSRSETVGLPLLEAMVIGLPILVANRPYAKALCGSQAIYFDPDDPVGLITALKQLDDRLRQGWWPNWHSQTASLPESWDIVADRMIHAIYENKVYNQQGPHTEAVVT